MRGLWLVTSFLALIIAGWLVTAPPHALAFYASGYLMDFLLGIGIAAYAPRMSPPQPWVSAALLVVATILLLILEVATLGRANVPVLGLVAAVIVYATIALERRGAMPAIGLLDMLGAASYSIYLTHIFVLAALRVAWKALSMPMTGMGQIMFMVVGLTASATVGTLVHLLYEKPANRLGRRLLGA
jgi:peptidoglycan/LPS O-acetylase OafA/YrhL